MPSISHLIHDNGARLRHVILAGLVGITSILSSTANGASPDPVKNGQMLRGKFDEARTLAGFAKPLVSKGTFLLVPGRGLIWNTDTPFPILTTVSAQGVVQYVNGQEAMRLSSSRLPGLSRLYDVLGAAVSGDSSTLTRTFKLTQSSEGEHWRIALTPLNATMTDLAQIKSVTLNGSRFVDSVDMDKGDGDSDHIAFTDQAAGPAALSQRESTLLPIQHQ